MKLQCPTSDRAHSRGRLLTEFLVALSFLFLALPMTLSILNSAAQSSAEVLLTERALVLAQQGMEEAVADPTILDSGAREETLGAGANERHQGTFVRKRWKTAVPGTNLSRVLVRVEWKEGKQEFRLERYVRNG